MPGTHTVRTEPIPEHCPLTFTWLPQPHAYTLLIDDWLININIIIKIKSFPTKLHPKNVRIKGKRRQSHTVHIELIIWCYMIIRTNKVVTCSHQASLHHQQTPSSTSDPQAPVSLLDPWGHTQNQPSHSRDTTVEEPWVYTASSTAPRYQTSLTHCIPWGETKTDTLSLWQDRVTGSLRD